MTARAAAGLAFGVALLVGSIAFAQFSDSPGALSPTIYPAPVSSDGDNQLPTGPTSQPSDLLRDGSLLVRRPGTLSRDAASGALRFTPDAPEGTIGFTPSSLGVLPNRQRTALESLVGGASTSNSSVRVSVTGLVTTYQLQNFLMIESASQLSTDAGADATLAASQPAAPATQPSSTSSASTTTTMPADRLLDQMLAPARNTAAAAAKPIRPSNVPLATDATSGAAAVAPGASSMNVMREGTFLVDRSGRLTRSADGQSWEFNLEADARAMKDPPLVILPNLKLMAMEQAVKTSSRDLRFRITGMVTEYGGRNYLLLEKMVVIPETASPNM